MNLRKGGLLRVLRRAGRPLMNRVRQARRRRQLREAMTVIRQARGARLVLIYHRIAPRDTPRDEIVPTVPVDLFRKQLTAFGELGRVLPLASLLSDGGDIEEPFRFALTFDDDYATHVQYVMPILREFGLQGTFFLSGRAVHGLGGYWFERLEALVAQRGLTETAGLLDVPGASDGVQVALRCEGDAQRQALIERHAPPGDSPLSAAGIGELAAAGMTIGFHTLQHPVLPGLTTDALRDALIEGRDRLEAIVGGRLQWLAYPHGKADGRTIALAREAGYSAAWTTQPLFLHANEDPYLHGRWEPAPVPVDDLLIRLGRLLQRTGCANAPDAS